MSERALHLVGSVPAEVATDVERGLTWILDGAGDRELTALPWDSDPGWITPWVLGRRDIVEEGAAGKGRKVFEIIVDGAAEHYDDAPLYRIASGVELRPEHLRLGRVREVAGTLPVFRRLCAARDRVGLRHQVSVPSPLDMALFLLANPNAPVGAVTKVRGIVSLLRHYRVFRDAVVGEVAELHAAYGDELVYQLESPTALAGLFLAPPAVRSAVARVMARQIAGVLRRFPSGAAVVLHLCYGDMGHQALVRPDSFAPAVVFLNALAVRLRKAGAALPIVHLPAAYGDQEPPTDPVFYRPLTRLDPAYRLYAGIADHRNADVSRMALRLFERAAGRRAEAVSTACGMGREPLELGTRALEVCRTLAAADGPAPRP